LLSIGCRLVSTSDDEMTTVAPNTFLVILQYDDDSCTCGTLNTLNVGAIHFTTQSQRLYKQTD